MPKGRRTTVDGNKFVRSHRGKVLPIIAHVESRYAAATLRPGIGVIDGVINQVVLQIARVPRVEGSFGSTAQVSFPFSVGKSALAPVGDGSGKFVLEAGAEVGMFRS